MSKSKNIKSNDIILESVLDEVLGGKLNKSLDELLKGTPNKNESDDNLKKAADIVNKGLEKEMNKIKNKEKELLIDSPVDVSKMKETKSNKVEVGLEGFVTPEEAAKITEKNSVRLINVNKTVNAMLELVEQEIVDAANAGNHEVTIDFFDGEYGEMLYAVRLVTVEKVIDRLTNYIDSLGYDVDLDLSSEENEDEDEYDFDLYAHLTISW